MNNMPSATSVPSTMSSSDRSSNNSSPTRISFDGQSNNNLTVQTNELQQIQQQAVVTPSPVHQLNHTTTTISNNRSRSTQSSSGLSQLQWLNISDDANQTSSHSPTTTTIGPKFFSDTVASPTAVTTGDATNTASKVQQGEETRYSTSSRKHFVNTGRKIDTIAPSSRSSPKIYYSDRFINPSRVREHQGTVIVPSSTCTKEAPYRLNPNATSNNEEIATQLNYNQENVNPNLPM